MYSLWFKRWKCQAVRDAHRLGESRNLTQTRRLSDLEADIPVWHRSYSREARCSRYIFKAYYDPDMTFGEMHHINFDWYAPRNCHRQTEEQVRQWCDEAGLDVEDEHIHQSGITIRARKR